MSPLPKFLLENDDYAPVPFKNTFAINQMHGIPRGSRGIDPVVLILGTQEEQNDYVWGVVIFTACSFAVFLLWTLVIVALKCCGTKRVGFFSGHPPQRPFPPPGYGTDLLLEPGTGESDEVIQSDELSSVDGNQSILENKNTDAGYEAGSTETREETSNSSMPLEMGDSITSFTPAQESKTLPENLDEAEKQHLGKKVESVNEQQRAPSDKAVRKYEADVKRYDNLVFWIRIMIVVSALGVFCSSVIFINVGVVRLAKTFDAGIEGMESINGFIQEGIDIINDFNLGNENLTAVIGKFGDSLKESGWCPLKRTELIEACKADNEISESALFEFDTTNCTFTGLPFQEELKYMWDILSRIDKILKKEISYVEKDLHELQDVIEYLASQANSLRWAFYVSASFAVLVDLVMFVLLYGVYLAWQRKLSKPFICIRSFLVVPIFLFLVFLVWLFAIIFCFGAVLTADFCAGGPSNRLLEIMIEQRNMFDSVTFDLVTYYLTDCAGPAINIIPKDAAKGIAEVLGGAHDITVAIGSIDESAYFEECGTDVSPLTVVVSSLHTTFHIVADAIAGVQRLFLCSSFFPVYEKIVYDAMCYLGASALRNIYIALFINLIFSLIFITFRAAWQEVDPNCTDDANKGLIDGDDFKETKQFPDEVALQHDGVHHDRNNATSAVTESPRLT